MDDASTVVVTLTWPTAADAKNYAASPILKDAMEKAGVLEKPTIYFAQDVEA